MNEIYKFYELYTENGTIYVYEKYKDGDGSYPETHELFTNEIAVRGYDELTFNGCKVPFKTRKRDLEGYVVEEYMKEIEPYIFYDNLEYFITTESGHKEMRDRTYSIFNYREKKGKQGKVIIPSKEPTIQARNNLALESLKKLIKEK